MNKRDYTNLFVSENIDKESMNEKAVDVYHHLDQEVQIKLDYHIFRSAWKDYREHLRNTIFMTIFVDRSQQIDQAFTASELDDIAFQKGIINCEFNRKKWEDALWKYDMSDNDEKQSFVDYHHDLVQSHEHMQHHLSDNAIEIYQRSNS